MEPNKSPEDGVIAIFVPGLPDTPGWMSLSRKKQDALLEHTSHIQQNRQLQMLGEFGELMELYQVEKLLEGEEMQMRDYLRRIYPDRHQRTIDRKLAAFSQIAATVPSSVMRQLTSVGKDMVNRFDRIAKAALGDIRNAVRELPLLPTSTEQQAEKYLEQLDSKLMEHRQRKSKGKLLHKDEQQASKMATNALINYIRSCGLQTSAEKRHWLARTIGWTMEAQAVTGTIKVSRLSIPDGVLIRRGRPKKKLKEAA